MILGPSSVAAEGTATWTRGRVTAAPATWRSEAVQVGDRMQQRTEVPGIVVCPTCEQPAATFVEPVHILRGGAPMIGGVFDCPRGHRFGVLIEFNGSTVILRTRVTQHDTTGRN
jgi:hypothetical protein